MDIASDKRKTGMFWEHSEVLEEIGTSACHNLHTAIFRSSDVSSSQWC